VFSKQRITTILVLTYIVAWSWVLVLSIPECPYLDYDEAIHAGSGMIIHDAIHDFIHGTRYSLRSFHYFNSGIIYWPFLHATLLGFWYWLVGLNVYSAIWFSIILGASALLLLYMFGRNHFSEEAGIGAMVILSMYKPFIDASRTVMLDMLQYLLLICCFNLTLRLGNPGKNEKRSYGILISIFALMLAFSRITGVVLLWAAVGGFSLFQCMRNRNGRLVQNMGGKTVVIALVLATAAIVVFYVFIFAETGYNILTAYREQQTTQEWGFGIKDLSVYPKMITASYNGMKWVLWIVFAAIITGLVMRKPEIHFLAVFLLFCFPFFQLINLKKIRLLLPWYGLTGLLLLSVLIELLSRVSPTRGMRWGGVAVLTLSLVFTQQFNSRSQRIRRTSGMEEAVKMVLKLARPREKILVKSFAADYFILMHDRPPTVVQVNYSNTTAVRGFTPDYIISEDNSQQDFNENIKTYLNTSGQWRLMGTFPGDETCNVFQKAIEEDIQIQ
jgi:hypothetical protein